MKVTEVRTITLRRPFSAPQANSKNIRSVRTHVLVVVETDAGIAGLGDAFGDPNLMGPIIERRLKPLVLGASPFDLEALWKRMFEGNASWEPKGSVVSAWSGIEVALWDLQGKALGLPVCQLLGGRARDRIEAYASDLHWEEPAAMADKARRFVDQGFRYVKTHIGREDADGDERRVAAIREAIGPRVGLLVDINTAFDRQTALARGKMFARYDAFWYEEPLPPMDLDGYLELKQRLPIPIAHGENEFTRYGFRDMFVRGSVDYAMPDILRAGGLLETKKICAMAEAFGVVVSPHNYSTGVGLAATLHLMAATPATALLEFDPTGTAVYEELFVDGLKIEGGFVHVPDRPGLGVELRPETLERYGR